MHNFFNSNKYLLFTGLFLTMILSCSGTDDPINNPPFEESKDVLPSNLSFEVTIQGVDENNLDGDGSGIITCIASADDTVKYEFRFGNGETIENTTGTIDYTYKTTGTQLYTVYVYAYSTTNNHINTSKQISIYTAPIAYNELVFSDEFDKDGSPNETNWGYNIGRGDNGWGNGEKQYYTKRSDNVIVKDGSLIITAKKENYEGAQYTSTRMLSEGKFDFTYGRVEVRAKLPTGEGTWPAIWMLGSNIGTAGWPACGEIDIMEHWGHKQGVVQSAMHTPSSYGDTKNHGSQTFNDVSTEFHVYEMYWTHEEIIFSVDGKQHYRYAPANKTEDTWPYTANQFIILNVAVGSSWLEIDPDFKESSMEIDYVRVYQ